MEIRRKLSLQFTGIVAAILLLLLLAVYISFSGARREEFYDRLVSKAKLVAQMLIDIDEIDADLIKKIEKSNPQNLNNEKIVIYNDQNKALYSTDFQKELKITKTLIEEVRSENEKSFKQEDLEVVGYFYKGQYDWIVVFAAATDKYGMNKLKNLRIILSLAFVSGIFVAYFAGKIFAVRALSPIFKIINQVEGVGASNLNERLEKGNGKDEIAKLAETFNKMLERLETAFKNQESFIANASHEIRTPITVITGQLEVILMKERTNEEYKTTLSSLYEDITNLNHISERMLLLAQTSPAFNVRKLSSVRCDDLLWQIRNEMGKRNNEYAINISFSSGITGENNLTVKGNELLLKTTMQNLIENGCKYSDNHTVEVLVDATETDLVLVFKDNGIGIPLEEITMIFEPFYRAKNTITFKGHGLGLSLVKNIISLHNGKIEVSSAPDKGSEFILSLPLA